MHSRLLGDGHGAMRLVMWQAPTVQEFTSALLHRIKSVGHRQGPNAEGA